MLKQFSKLIFAFLSISTPAFVFAQALNDDFSPFSYSASSGLEMPYRLHTPSLESGAKYPLIIYLHGSGGAGTDNIKQISGGNIHGTHLWLKPEVAVENPAFVLAPQIPTRQLWSASDSEQLAPYAVVLIELISKISSQHPIDADRIYIMGQSLGGMGVWDIVSKQPNLFAAAVPVCGRGDTTRIVNARSMAIWAFHGAEDTAVSVTGSREMVASLKAVDGNISYTEYPNVGHNSWEKAFAEPALPEWLFSKLKVQDRQ